MIRFLRTVRLALKSLLLHKLRSGLTMLGIVFGVFSVIAMLAIGEGASSQAQQQVLQLGATNIIIRSVKPPDDVSATRSSERQYVLRYGLTREDFRVLHETLCPKFVEQMVPLRESFTEVRNGRYGTNCRIVGCTPDYLGMNHLTVSRGRFLADEDSHDQSNVAILAQEAAQKLFPLESPINRAVRISGQAFRVVGVMQERSASAGIGGSFSAQDYNRDVYVPLSTFQARINSGDVVIRFSSGNFSAESVIYSQITLKVPRLEDVVRTSEVVRETLVRLHGAKQDFAIVVPLELLRQAEQLRNIFNVVLGSIAGISLLVGGIGIMNIMLATVTERTREIGIRRALGARRRDVIEQFLTETIVLSGTGGLIGVAMGLSTPLAFRGVQYLVTHYILDQSAAASDVGRMFLEMTPAVPWWSLPVAFGFSVVTGVAFGVYPARTAAQLDPIEALRHE